jgi:putative FmdB family regulatory protein
MLALFCACLPPFKTGILDLKRRFSRRPYFDEVSTMPIYAYKCDACGHTLDALQKMSDAPLTVCPHCGKPALHKQVTAAGFQLKGSGWYATDFKGGGAAATSTAAAASSSDSAAPPACGASCACH